ncbi:MAG: hypothetical protein ACRD82_07135 [Blastocatellia bacterium]
MEPTVEVESDKAMERFGRIEDLDRSLDLEFWQAQSAEARVVAAWELTVTAYQLNDGEIAGLRMQKQIESFRRVPFPTFLEQQK